MRKTLKTEEDANERIIEYLEEDIDYIISIDESGIANLKDVLAARNDGKIISENDKNFTIAACVIKKEDFLTSQNMIMELKNKYWEDALFKYGNCEKRV